MLPPARRIAAVPSAAYLLLSATALPCRLPATCHLQSAADLPPAACRPPPCHRATVLPCRLPARAALSGISDIAARALFPALPFSPFLSGFSRLLPFCPGALGGGGSKTYRRPVCRVAPPMGEYACRYSGSFPVPQRVLGLGPSHSSSRPPRANSSCGNQKLLSTRPLRRARWI